MKSKLSSSQIQEYLEVLNVSLNDSPDLATLNTLTYAHQTTIPFSSADIYHCKSVPSLEVDDVFNKAITKRRGGYCFEMNLIFKELLLALGYDARPAFCRINRLNWIRLPITHQGTIVTIDDMRYYVDIGFGGPVAAGALALNEGVEQVVHGETYRMQPLDECWWTLERLSSQFIEGEAESPWTVVLELCLAKAEDQDFQPLSLFCAQPGARFHESTVLNLRTSTGNYAMENLMLTIRENGKKQIIELPDEAAQAAAIEKYFGFKR